jgi:hypothetical protein
MPRASPFLSWTILVLGILVAGVGVTSTWVAGKLAFGQPATGKVVQFQRVGTSSRSASIEGVVDVTIPGGTTFRDDVDDDMGSQDWEVGGDVSLRCTHFYADHWSCSADSGMWRFAFPLFFLSAGVGMVWWSVLTIRGR